jgi:hypothetical protein
MIFRQPNTGNRPDLASVEVNWPIGYIGRMFFPVGGTAEKANGFTHQTVTSDATPEEDRAWSDALTQTRIAATRATYSCTKQEKRYVLTEDDVKELGGMDSADQLGAKAAKRSLMRKFETDAYEKVFTSARRSAALELTAGSEFQILGFVGDNVRRVSGRLSLVCSHQWFLAFTGLAAVATQLNARGAIGAVLQSQIALGLQTDVITGMLRTILPFEQVIIGDREHWSANAGYAAIAMLPDVSGDSMMAAKIDPIYGLSKWFRPDPVSPENLIGINAEWLPETKVNAYDATAYYDIMELNAAGVSLVKLPAGTEYTTTTTTTTTTTSTTTT